MESEQNSVKSTTTDSSAAEKVNTTILEKVIERFSFIEDHQIRGKWRYVLSSLVVILPLFMFLFTLCYFLLVDCIPKADYYAYGTTSPTFKAITTQLQQRSVYFCASSYAAQNTSAPGYYYFYSEYESVNTYLCNLKSSPPSSVTGRSICRNAFQQQSFGSSTETISCAVSKTGFTVYYAECIPVQTAFVNSVQLGLYTLACVIYIYLFARVVKKFGCVGLFKLDNWKKTLHNKTWKLKTHEEAINALV